jgi:hypothetical protein
MLNKQRPKTGDDCTDKIRTSLRFPMGTSCVGWGSAGSWGSVSSICILTGGLGRSVSFVTAREVRAELTSLT